MSAVAPITADWIAADWGTTHLRLWAMDAADRVIAHAESDDGMATLDREGYEPALLRLCAPWLAEARKTPVIVCGMAGSRQGWVEAPYAAAPCPPPGLAQATPVATRDARLGVAILPGIRQDRPSADVMRGEETQVAGLIAREPGFDGVVCLPGTHSKWVRVSAGEVVGFATYMTGELYALLSEHSVLRHSVAGAGWDEAAFLDAVPEAMARPEALAARLFTIRAETLLTGLPPSAARARLSGLLIGVELAAARPYWLGQRVALLGAPKLAGLYATALAAQGLTPEVLDAEAMTLAGLVRAREQARETAQ